MNRFFLKQLSHSGGTETMIKHSRGKKAYSEHIHKENFTNQENIFTQKRILERIFD